MRKGKYFVETPPPPNMPENNIIYLKIRKINCKPVWKPFSMNLNLVN
jgi:hypothetical protein